MKLSFKAIIILYFIFHISLIFFTNNISKGKLIIDAVLFPQLFRLDANIKVY